MSFDILAHIDTLTVKNTVAFKVTVFYDFLGPIKQQNNIKI